MIKQVAIFIGPPGSGKDTQADFLEEEYGFAPVPTSKIIRDKIAANPTDPIMIRERELFDSGKLNTQELVTQWVAEFIESLAAEGKSIVFSGSPRRPLEAQMQVKSLTKLYGLEYVTVFHLQLTKEESLARIAGRRFCTANKHPVPSTPEFANVTVCPKDGSPLERRALDAPDKQETRFHEYHTLTEPALEILREAGMRIVPIDSSREILAVHAAVVGVLEREKFPVPKE